MVIGSTIGFMAVAAWQAMPWWEYAFLSDDSAVAWLSSALLLANAAVALNLTIGRSLPSTLGSLLTLALVALAVDEQFLLHERIKESLPPALGEAPTVLVGIGGVIALAALVRAVKDSAVRGLVLAAVAIGVFALWTDVGLPPTAVARLEEAYEVLAESLFLCGLLAIPRAHVQSAS